MNGTTGVSSNLEIHREDPLTVGVAVIDDGESGHQTTQRRKAWLTGECLQFADLGSEDVGGYVSGVCWQLTFATQLVVQELRTVVEVVEDVDEQLITSMSSSSTGRGNCFTPCWQHRLARWQMHPMSRTCG